MNVRIAIFGFLFSLIAVFSCNQQSGDSKQTSSVDTSSVKAAAIIEQPVTYSVDGKNFNGYIDYDSNQAGKRPAILVVHEWWGLTNYTRNRAKQLAGMGYIAMAVDMYGNGKIAEDPKTAQEYATPYYKNPALSKTVLDAAIDKLKTLPEADTSKMAAIGYCYGGFIVLNAAKLGANLKGVVSFHGDLSGVQPDKNALKAKILICQGGDDKFVTPEQGSAFKKSMDSAGISFTFKSYPNATHAFTNPEATAYGKKFNMPIEYNAAADSASWHDMKDFFKTIF